MVTMALSGAGSVLMQGSGLLPDFATFPSFWVHQTIAIVLVILIILHFIGALYHQFIQRDRLLARMGIGRG